MPLSANQNATVQTLPAKPGDWVVAKHDLGRVAKVKDVYRDEHGVAVDLVLYARSGDVIGRESPAMGGPRTFEPSLNYEDWERIDDPKFPIELRWIPDKEDPTRNVAAYATRGKRLPDLEWTRPVRKSKTVRARKPSTDFNPEMEAAARRMAAQELRDMFRSKIGSPDALVKRAEELERGADSIAPRK